MRVLGICRCACATVSVRLQACDHVEVHTKDNGVNLLELRERIVVSKDFSGANEGEIPVTWLGVIKMNSMRASLLTWGRRRAQPLKTL